ncbi:anthrone oxygenase family protein [Quadrisphaera granulorum]|uniref:anthrone oxygenase family protein n=1 Tax=Quadrisphaera granulorum TaxID=317664 RepID=UPI0014754308|nr:anthrone oxygenase family protein [Quadrisphaera granulorum]
MRTRAGVLAAGLAVVGTAGTGLVAGVHVSGGPLVRALRQLDPSTFVLTKHALDEAYPLLMKPLLLATLIVMALTTAAAAVSGRRRTALLAGTAVAALVVVLMAILRGDLPLNQQMATWDPSAPPADWREVRTEWEQWFAVRAVAACAAFAASVAVVVSAVRHR